MALPSIAFIDRDGTLIEEPDDEQVDALGKLRLLPKVVPSLLRLRDAGFRLVMVSNQDGLGTPAFPTPDFEAPQRFLLDLLASQGIEFDEVFICPHTPDDGCDCRKPRTGLLTRFLRDTQFDHARSVVIGDRDADMELAVNLGIDGVRVGENGIDWPTIAARLTSVRRHGFTRRTTRETDIEVEVDLDQAGSISVSTGIGFLDHMIEQIASHGGMSLRLVCRGDLEIDEHHTVEDTALTLGDCIGRALGSRAGIARYGFLLPMDESLATIALDLSGRPYCRFDAEFTRERVGGLPTELVGHFFHSLSQTLGATLHIAVTGENAHHQIEAVFKGVGRALRQAIRIEATGLPSTKGVL